MTSLNIEVARLLLRNRLLDNVDDLPVECQWENRVFTPPDPIRGSIWLREKLLLANERKTSTGFVQTLGQYRIDIFVPIGDGTTAAERLAKDVRDVYEAGTKLEDTAASVGVQVYRAERGQGQEDSRDGAVWFRFPVLVYWRTFSAV